MSQHLLYPMFFYIIYMFGLIGFNLKVRLKAVKTGQVSPHYFKTYVAKENLPDNLKVLERHIDNQFQLPLIFFMTCTVHLAMNQVNTPVVVMAWLFVASRLFHSYVHLGSNKVLRRARVYAVGWLILISMWIKLIISTI